MTADGTYKDYQLFWTGWKFAQNSTRIVAQWLAWGRDQHIVAGYPGPVGFYNVGETFDISCHDEAQKYCYLEELKPWIPDTFTGLVDLDALPPLVWARRTTLNRLIAFIEQNIYDPNYVWEHDPTSIPSPPTSAALLTS